MKTLKISLVVVFLGASLTLSCATQKVMAKKTDMELIQMYSSRSYWSSVPVDLLLTCGAYTARNAVDRNAIKKELWRRGWVLTPEGWAKKDAVEVDNAK